MSNVPIRFIQSVARPDTHEIISSSRLAHMIDASLCRAGKIVDLPPCVLEIGILPCRVSTIDLSPRLVRKIDGLSCAVHGINGLSQGMRVFDGSSPDYRIPDSGRWKQHETFSQLNQYFS